MNVVHVFFARVLVGRGFIVALLGIAIGVGIWLTPSAQFDLRLASLALFAVACAVGLLFEPFISSASAA